MPKHLQYNKAESEEVGYVLNVLSSIYAVDAKLKEEFEKHQLKGLMYKEVKLYIR